MSRASTGGNRYEAAAFASKYLPPAKGGFPLVWAGKGTAIVEYLVQVLAGQLYSTQVLPVTTHGTFDQKGAFVGDYGFPNEEPNFEDSSTERLALKIAPATGVVTGSFTSLLASRRVQSYGVLNQKTGEGNGFFWKQYSKRVYGRIFHDAVSGRLLLKNPDWENTY